MAKMDWEQLAKETDPDYDPANEPIACPKCKSPHVYVSEQGFGLGKAIAGVLLTGPLGLLAGAINKNKLYCQCLKCGKKWQPGE